MKIREIILTHLAAAVEEHSPAPFPDDVNDETLLESFWLDSIAFVSMLVAIEADVGFIPAKIMTGEAFPETIGDLI